MSGRLIGKSPGNLDKHGASFSSLSSRTIPRPYIFRLSAFDLSVTVHVYVTNLFSQAWRFNFDKEHSFLVDDHLCLVAGSKDPDSDSRCGSSIRTASDTAQTESE